MSDSEGPIGPSVPETDTDVGEDAEVGSFEEDLPDLLVPLYHGFQRFQGFRETYGSRYVWVLEAIVAATLTVGYVYWLYLFFIAG